MLLYLDDKTNKKKYNRNDFIKLFILVTAIVYFVQLYIFRTNKGNMKGGGYNNIDLDLDLNIDDPQF